MTTTTAKGKYYEKKVQDELKSMGALVEPARAKIIWIKGRPISLHHDFFGLFDGIAIPTRGMWFMRSDETEGFFIEPIPMDMNCIHSINKGESIFYQVKYQGEKTHGDLAEVRRKIREFPAVTKCLIVFKKEGNKVNRVVEWL